MDIIHGPHGPATGKICDGASVGVLVLDDLDRVLVGTRADGAGVAPIAGHVFDAHPGYVEAAHAEVAEEAAMTVVPGTLVLVGGGHRLNRCARGDGPDGPGHHWQIYTARAIGTPRSADAKLGALHWADRAELEALMQRTLARARGRVTDPDWAAAPGIEPVWCRWILTAGLADIDRDELAEIDRTVDVNEDAEEPGWRPCRCYGEGCEQCDDTGVISP
ncbi:NUDIX domain-containing protein (plasmid) [Actinomadura graeca]|uniref:NUDIX domain-containing protein n=1 Tax=Actinomadura graeca TaxID=2750812 RepID=A0ABX8R7M0_9ACTN|nr:NUDIX domain-containing protein [Actinomadura graeca]QXJ27089.1 NUDIX domain-containing protein [Actinomadura graeca]